MTIIKKIFIYLGVTGSTLFLANIILLIYILFGFLRKKWKLYNILYKNLSKKVYFVLPNNTDEYKMENEIKSIDNKIFTIDTGSTSYNNLKLSDNVGLVVVGYKKGCVDLDTFKELLVEIGKNTPIIFYTYGNNQAFDFREGSKDEISNHLNKFDNYLVDNFPLKLIGDTYSILSIYKR